MTQGREKGRSRTVATNCETDHPSERIPCTASPWRLPTELLTDRRRETGAGPPASDTACPKWAAAGTGAKRTPATCTEVARESSEEGRFEAPSELDGKERRIVLGASEDTKRYGLELVFSAE